jgi:hypothetical protein
MVVRMIRSHDTFGGVSQRGGLPLATTGVFREEHAPKGTASAATAPALSRDRRFMAEMIDPISIGE